MYGQFIPQNNARLITWKHSHYLISLLLDKPRFSFETLSSSPLPHTTSTIPKVLCSAFQTFLLSGSSLQMQTLHYHYFPARNSFCSTMPVTIWQSLADQILPDFQGLKTYFICELSLSGPGYRNLCYFQVHILSLVRNRQSSPWFIHCLRFSLIYLSSKWGCKFLEGGNHVFYFSYITRHELYIKVLANESHID